MESQGSERGCPTTAGAGILQGSAAGRGEPVAFTLPPTGGWEVSSRVVLPCSWLWLNALGMGCAFLELQSVPDVTTARQWMS